jgi:hypothetical protein
MTSLPSDYIDALVLLGPRTKFCVPIGVGINLSEDVSLVG